MSLDVYLEEVKPTEVYGANITHNLVEMAREAVLYWALWHPEELGVTKAKELIDHLQMGLERLKADPEKYRAFNPENGWGSYEGFMEFVEKYLKACRENPDATVRVSR